MTRIVVARYAPWAAALILLGVLGLAGGLAFATYHASTIRCVRPAPAITPRCEAEDHNGFFTSTYAFGLAADTLTIREHKNDGAKHVVIDVPGGELGGAVDRPFAERTVAAARALVSDGSAMRWSTRTTSKNHWYILLGALAIAIPLAFVFRTVTVDVDPEAHEVRVTSGRWVRGRRTTIPFSSVRSAEVEDIDESDFHSLVLLMSDDQRRIVAQGRNADVKVAAAAIKQALRGKSSARARVSSSS